MKYINTIVTTTFIFVIILGTAVVALSDNNAEVPYFNDTFSPQTCLKWPPGEVMIGVRGNYTCEDMYYLYSIKDEWNELGTSVTLNITRNLSPTDVELLFVDRSTLAEMRGDNPDLSNMAGCTFFYHDGHNITRSYIYVLTDYPDYRFNVIEHEVLHAMGLMYHSGRTNSALYMYAQDTPHMSIDDIGVVITIYNRP